MHVEKQAHESADDRSAQAARRTWHENKEAKHTIYAWKAKYSGMDVTQAQEAKQLRDKKAQLKELVGESQVAI